MSREQQNQAINTIILNVLSFVKASNAKPSLDKLFSMIWDIVFDKLYLNGIHQSSSDMNNELYGAYQLNVREFLLYKIISIFRHYKIDYSPMVYTDEVKLLEKIKTSKKSVVLVSTHNGFSHNLKLFEDLGRGISTIGIQHYVKDALSKSGIKNDINIISKDKFSLVFLKKAVADGDLISCTVDYSVNKGPFQHINPNLFKFAAQEKLKIYFTKSEIQDNGFVRIIFGNAPTVNDGDANAQAYIKFYNSNVYSRRILKVGD